MKSTDTVGGEFSRVYDNTVPQTAWAHFENPHNRFLEYGSKGYLMDFITTYVNAPRRLVPIPLTKRSGSDVTEPFIKLWQDGAAVAEKASDLIAEMEVNSLLRDFVESVADSPDKWSKWITFQWTPSITPGFKARRDNWQDEIPAAHELLYDILPDHKTTKLIALKDFLRRDLKPLDDEDLLDREYKSMYQDRKLGISREDFAVAYALDWFVRGSSYASRFHSQSMVKFHNLRNSFASNDDIDLQMPYEVDWGWMLYPMFGRGDIKRDESFCEILRDMRTAVQKLRVHDWLVLCNGLNDDEDRQPALIKAVIDVYQHAKITPKFRNESEWIEWAKSLPAGEPGSKIVGPVKLVARMLKAPIGMKSIRRAAFKAAGAISPKFCFRIFDIPKPRRRQK